MSADATLYEPIDGELHRHGARLTHAHPHAGPHVRDEPELHHDPGVAVVASAAAVAIGLPVADPLIGLAITAVILRITWQSWRISGSPTFDHDERDRFSLSFRRPRRNGRTIAWTAHGERHRDHRPSLGAPSLKPC